MDRATRAHQALAGAIDVFDPGVYHRESRRFHLALIQPCRMQRLMRMFEAAWNVTEPFQPMRYVSAEKRLLLHEDHGGMLAAFAAGTRTAWSSTPTPTTGGWRRSSTGSRTTPAALE